MNNVPFDSALEAVLFASGSPVSVEKLCEIFECEPDVINDSASRLSAMLADSRGGIELISVDGAYQLCTKSCYADFVKKALELRKTPPLSRAALEVLAIVSYNQPVTKAFVETVRGTDSDSVVNSLCDKGLLRESGHLDAPGRPALFSTTDAFLRCFGLDSLEQLPQIDAETQLTLEDAAYAEPDIKAENGENE